MRVEDIVPEPGEQEAELLAYKTILDSILKVVSPTPSNENVLHAVRRVTAERDKLKQVLIQIQTTLSTLALP